MIKRSLITPILLTVAGLQADATSPPTSPDFPPACLPTEKTVVFLSEEAPSDRTWTYRTSSQYPAVKQRFREFEGKQWTNGFDFFIAMPADGYINFSGGSLHEGGSSFGLTPEDDHYRLRGGFFVIDEDTPEGDGYIAINGSAGDRVEVRQFGETGVFMTVYNAKDIPTEVLHPTNDLRETIETDIVTYCFAGEYRTEDGRTFTFFPGRKEVKGFAEDGKSQSYTFGNEYETPVNIIILDDGRSFRIEKSDDGLLIRKCTYYSSEDLWTDGNTYATPQRIRYLFEAGNISGDFPFTALQPMTCGQLEHFTRNELRLMRNEIYARHGMRFRSADLQKHFEAKAWYAPTSDDVSKQLSEIERINIEMIRQIEKRHDENR